MHLFRGLNKKDGITPINPAQEDGNLQVVSDRFITILGASGQSWDSLTTNIVTITHSHDYIHDGLRFFAHEYYSGLAATSSRYYTIITGSKLAHYVVSINTNAEIVYKLFESPTVTVNGSSLTANNRNRSSSNTPLTSVYAGSTVTADGTELEAVLMGSGKASPSEVRGEEEIDLKPNTTYCVKITANAQANYSINIDFYET